ncbi:Major royal jelly protein [Epibacterium ulvae]|uniref:Major royal jelly protein n=1 Tax=Epibacterium ulvae TaxID=1156985 RepID=A0A1G5RGB5_9RHOB|nr:L-dopachrome tautomerase-related protein [Epibacterium ulvae]SCZ73113.1 Major royal jelly protein [Epibacterium ulvae]
MKHILYATCALTFMTGTTFAQGLETYLEFPKDTPPGNLAIAPDGRMFMSVHEFYGPDLRIVEVMPDGTTVPYPTEAWAHAPNDDGDGLQGVLGLRADRQGILWMLDGQGEGQTGRVVGWNTNTEELHAIYYIGQPAARPFSFLNDLAVDRENEAIYITDTANHVDSALIVIDLKTGRARRVLEGSEFTRAEDTPMIIDGKEILLGGNPAKIGVNPITVDPSNTWVYFAPMTSTSMYRVRTTDLLDESLNDEDLAARVERYGDKVTSDGSTVDADGNVYITAMTDNALGVTKPDGTYEVLYQSDDDLPWPDGFSMGVDGYVYATINELHRSPVLNGGEDASLGTYRIVRFPALGTAVSGR